MVVETESFEISVWKFKGVSCLSFVKAKNFEENIFSQKGVRELSLIHQSIKQPISPLEDTQFVPTLSPASSSGLEKYIQIRSFISFQGVCGTVRLGQIYVYITYKIVVQCSEGPGSFKP